MKFSIRYLKSKTVYGRLRNDTQQYWNFSTLVWDAAESANTKVTMTEYADADPNESSYKGSATAPAGGPWSQEAVDSATNVVVGYDDNVMGSLTSVPSSDASYLEQIKALYGYFFNKRTATEAEEEVFNDSGTSLGTAALSDDGTTFTKDKIV